MKYVALLVFTFILLSACKGKKKTTGNGFVSVTSLIKKEVEDVDTSLYSIYKTVSRDSSHQDTTYIPREKFSEEAKEFLALPDFSDPDVAARFKEENRYDSLIDRIIITYTPVDSKREEIKKVELIVSTEIMSDGNNKVTNIIIDKGTSDRNGAYYTKMLWIMGKKFLITHSTLKPAEPEKMTVTRLVWNDDEMK